MKEKFLIKIVHTADETAYVANTEKEDYCRKPKDAKKFDSYVEAQQHIQTLQVSGYYNIEKIFMPA